MWKKTWSYISYFFLQELPYSNSGTPIAHFHELQKEDPIVKRIQKELATSNVNIYSSQSGK